MAEAAERIDAVEARQLADDILKAVRPCAERAEIAGSVRRQSPMVKDVEIIVLNPTPDYFRLLDLWVENGVVAKALYGANQGTKWGDKFRGLIYQDLRFELYCADPENWGYIAWLRTGPGDANKYIMNAFTWKPAPFVLKDGYGWAGDKKLCIASETDMFALLGMEYIPAAERSEKAYRVRLKSPSHHWGDPSRFIVPPRTANEQRQDGLFDDAGGDIPTAASVRGGGPTAAEDLYFAQHLARRYGETPEYWLNPDRPDLVDYLKTKGTWKS